MGKTNRWNFTVLEAKDGGEALSIIHDDDSINMLLTDYNMPVMDGVHLVREARKKFSKTRLPVIGLSGMGRAAASAHFLKAGANDYIHKPFLAEELYCRVRHNIETSEYIKLIREMAERDFLTGLFNRRAFFSIVNKMFAGAQRGNKSIVVAMMDIDHFKKCNDTFGHDAGDDVICFVADAISKRVRESDIVARFGGEEYCVVCLDMDKESINQVFEEIRTNIENSLIVVGEHEIRVTVSIGVCTTLKDSLDEMIITADRMLYQAKEKGRNQVMVDAKK
ncbi:MAG: diguanylate cyclase [Desulfovibrionales bacterium]|nr:diguanylate cyclase [Desulfovibrionales bacterium]